MNQELPKYIGSRSIAKWLGPTWRPQRIQRILRNMGIARKVGRSVVVTPEDLAGQWPEVYELVLEKIAQIPEVDHGLAGKPRNGGKKGSNLGEVSKQTRVKSDTESCADCVAGRKCYSHYEYG